MKKITKLVLPVAGLGKRLLPLTQRTPKGLLPVNGKPLIEYILEEAVLSGIKEVALIVNPKHRRDFEAYLRKNKKKFPTLTFQVRTQSTPGGNGHAIVQAYDFARDEPFAVRFCDDIILGNPPILKGLIDVFEHYRAPVFLLEPVPKKDVSRFGVVGFKKMKKPPSFFGGKVHEITKIVEKPKKKEAPSLLAIIGGYILTPEVLRNLKMVADTLPIVADDALPIAVAFQIQLILHAKLYGWEFPGRRIDCGTLEKLEAAEKLLQAGIG